MALNAKKALAAANQYTDETVIGGGAIKGKNCTIDSIEPISGGQRVTFKWTLDDGTEQTTTMDVMNGQDGKGIKSVAINEESHLIITYTDDTTYDAGAIEVHSAVDSVNGKTGEVTLDASDVGALPDDTAIPSKTSDLDNDSNFVVDASYVHTDNNYDATAKGIVDGVTTALAGKVDKETGKSLIDLTTVVDGASYDSTNHLILFKHQSTTLFSLDASAFVKDGMVDTVEITGGNLVITFNTDAGKQAISIPLTDIFDPSNYYNKTATDNLLADKTDKVASATNGNFAGLDANGNLTDSGKSASDFGTADEIADIVNVYGSKNLMETTALSHTQNGITKTVNADGSFTLNGTATDNTYFYWMGLTTFPTENIRYTYSIETSAVWGVEQSSVIAGIDKRSETAFVSRYISIFADGKTHIEGTFTGESGYYAWAWIFIPKGTQLTDVIVKGMIRMASIKDDTFVPYAKTNGALTIDKAEQAEVNDIVNVLGAKNLLPQVEHANTTMTINGVTITSREDGSVLLNGTSTDAVPYHFIRLSSDANRKFIKQVAGKKVTISGTNVSNTNAKVQFWSATTNVIADTTGKGTTFTIPSDLATTGDYNFAIYISSGVTVNNVVVYPMLRLASDPDDTYQPYAMTNRELTEKLQSSASVVEVKSLMDSTYVSSCNSCRYCVSNGICYVYINNIKFTSAAVDTTDCLILPTSVLPTSRIPATSMAWGSSQIPIFFTVGTSGNMVVNGITSANQNTTWYGVSFSYPVAE